jgi:glycosyltransferase involved in cell wall biosynthesis
MNDVDFVIPVYNEEVGLFHSVESLVKFLIANDQDINFTWRIVIVDNGSRDKTLSVANTLSSIFSSVNVISLPEKGRGRALKAAWINSDSKVLAYMDVDLSTSLFHIVDLIHSVFLDGFDCSIGSRLMPESYVSGRSFFRTILSKGYVLLIKLLFRSKLSDFQCGFKALRSDIVRQLLPLVKDNFFFFDTELLLIAEKNKLKIKEIPVKWNDDPDSRVDLPRTIFQDLCGLFRLRLNINYKKISL